MKLTPDTLCVLEWWWTLRLTLWSTCVRGILWHKYLWPLDPHQHLGLTPKEVKPTLSCRREKIKAKVLNIPLVMAESLGNTSLIKPFGHLCFDFYLDSLSAHPWWSCECAASMQHRGPHHTQWAFRSLVLCVYSKLPRPRIPLVNIRCSTCRTRRSSLCS